MTNARRHVLVRSSWATVNIGDVAHSPGVIRSIQRTAPDAEVTLWAVRLGDRERQMLSRALPDVQIVSGIIDDDGPSTPELARVLDRADVLVHGSGAGIFCGSEFQWWRERTGKPYGYFGVTADPLSPPTMATLSELGQMVDHLPPTYMEKEMRDHLNGADFVYCRDSLTLRYFQRQEISAPVLAFGPDGTFSYDYLDHDAADTLLAGLGLGGNDFACFVPRLRYSPYARIYGTEPTREQYRREAINAATARGDLSALVDAITIWVRETGKRALVVPEMSYAVQVAEELLAPLLPDDVRARVHILDRYWPLEEATAVYARSSLVVSMECHSPILAAISHVPVLYLRQPSETVKGAMYADLGAPDTVIEIGHRAGIRQAMDAVISDPAAASVRSADLHNGALDVLREMAGVVVNQATATIHKG